MRSRHVVGLLLVALAVPAACADVSSGRTGTGNMIDAALVKRAAEPSWTTGELVVEQAASGTACLLLRTPSRTWALRSATPSLTAVAWQTHGSFDESLSGIMRDGQIVVPYDTARVTVRGGLVAASDVVCPRYPTWGLLDVRTAR